jgi:hypothetical protein
MTEVTRISCPGCRESLRFEPEALDFPANCAACDSRFLVGVYIRVCCPKCQRGSKVRESLRGERVRCQHCQHGFVADDGIGPGGGGLLLVTRLLDTDSPTPPETIQPFLGHARVDAVRYQAPPTVEKVLEAERLQALALAERDRLAEEAAFLKAILARIVAIQPEPEPEPTPILEPVEVPGLEESEARIAGLVEERDRLELLAQGLKAQLDGVSLEAESSRRAARVADRRIEDLEERLERACREILESEAECARLVDDHAEALETEARQRSVLLAKAARLHRAARSAMNGEAEALYRLGEFVIRSVEDHSKTLAERDRERGARQELARLVEGLKTEVEAARSAEADHRAGRDRLAESLAESERGRLELRAESERLKTAIEAETRADPSPALLLEKGRLVAELESVKSDASRRQKAQIALFDRLKQEFDKLGAENKALGERIKVLDNPSRATPAEGAILGSKQMVDHRDLVVTMLYGDDGDGRDRDFFPGR